MNERTKRDETERSVGAIEKGKRRVKDKSITLVDDKWMLKQSDAIVLVEQTAKAYAVEELEKVVSNHIWFGDDVDPQDIVYRIKSLKDEQELRGKG